MGSTGSGESWLAELTAVGNQEFYARLREQHRTDLARSVLSAADEACIRQVLHWFHAGAWGRCSQAVDNLPRRLADDPRASAVGTACRALESGRLAQGVEACGRILRCALYSPDAHCALVLLLLRSRRRAEAHQVLRRGLSVAPGHPGLTTLVAEMGMRRRPPVRFLPRAHPVNRTLGLLRSRLSSV